MRTFAAIPFYFVIACMIMLLASCSVVHKVFNKHKETLDSTAVHKSIVDSSRVKDSTAVHDTSSTNEQTLTIDFPVPDIKDSGVFTPVTVMWNGQMVLVNHPVKSLTLHAKNTESKKDSVHTSSLATYQKTTSDSTHENKQVNDTSRKVDRSRVPLWIYALCFLIILLAIAYRYRKQLLSIIFKI